MNSPDKTIKPILHPGNLLSADAIEIFRRYASEAEKMRALHPAQLEKIYAEKFFKLFVPKEYGGLELDLIDGLKMEEALSWADGSVGWTVTLCAGANWFIGYLQTDVAVEIFNDEKVCLAGSGRANGIASINDNGYEVNGCWKYATGAPHATVFTAKCQVERNGVLLKNESGEPMSLTFWFRKEEVIIHKDWNTTGMVATASHSFEVQVQIPHNRAFVIDGAHAVLDHPIYRYPFLQFAEATLAVNLSGMSISFLDLCEELIRKTNCNADDSRSEIFKKKIAVARSNLNALRQIFYAAIEASWDELVSLEFIHEELLQDVSAASLQLSTAARKIVDDLYPYCGMGAADSNSEINRVWRDIHTASQHCLLRPD